MIGISRALKNNRGQALVEFALLAWILLILLMSIIDFGRAFYSYVTVAGIARETARFAVVRASDTKMETRVNEVTGLLDSSNLTISLDGDTIYSGGVFDSTSYNVTGDKGTAIKAEVAYQMSFITPLIEYVVGTETITIRSSCSMALE